MLTTSNDYDGPAFNTRIRTVQQIITEHLTPQPNTDTVTPDITTIKDTPDVMLKPLTKDRLHASDYRCRGWTHSTSASPNVYQMEKPQSMRLTSFLHIKGLLYKHVMDSNQKFLALVIPKA